MIGSFRIIDEIIVEREGDITLTILHSKRQIEAHCRRFNQLREHSLYDEEARALILRYADSYSRTAASIDIR